MDATREINTNSESKNQTISDAGIKNFLSAVCDIVAYDLKNEKNFAAIEFVLTKLKTDKVFSQAIENNAKILKERMCDDIQKIILGDKYKHKSTIYNSFRESKICYYTYEFCMFASFFLPQGQRNQLQNELLTEYYKEGEFYRKVPLSLEEYLSDDLKKIIDSKDNQRINTELDNNLNHYEINKIKDDNDEFNNDKELQTRYIKLLKVIRDDIAFGNDEIYKKNKNGLLESNNNFVEKISNIQERYKQMPGWLRSEFRSGWLDDLNVRDKSITTKNGQVLAYKLCTKNSSGDKIITFINGILKSLGNNDLKHDDINVSTERMCLMNFLSFFYYGLNLKFFADLFRLDMHKEDFTILFALSIVIAQVVGFVCFPFALPIIHIFSSMFGLAFLGFNLALYQKKCISSEDVSKYNLDLNEFSDFIQKNFNEDAITLQINSVSTSQDYDKVIDGYEKIDNLQISSGCCEDCKCNCPDDCCECGSCDCPDLGDCLCGCLDACAKDPHCCECVGWCCLALVCPLCIPCIAGGRQL